MSTAPATARPLRIVVVEDETDLASLLEYVLGREGFRTEIAHSARAALDALEQEPADLVLLDLMLPDLDGLQVLKALKQSPQALHTRVIILSAKRGEEDRVLGFELGAHDYIVKPFSPRELVLRVRTVLAREHPGGATERHLLRAGPIELELEQHEVLVEGKRVTLTLTEFRLLAALLRNAGRVRSREALLTEVWGYDSEAISRTVDTHVRRLRHKLGVGASWLATVRGVGYRIQDPRAREG